MLALDGVHYQAIRRDAIMQLVERGIVDLDAPVVKYFPYFRLADDRYSQITVRRW